MARFIPISIFLATVSCTTGVWLHTHSLPKSALAFLSGGVVSIATKIWAELFPLWTKRVSSAIDLWLTIHLSGFSHRYAEYLKNRLGFLDQNGFQSLDSLVRYLEDVYVELLVEDAPAVAVSQNPLGYLQAASHNPATFFALLNGNAEHRRNFAVLGPPGCGKSTLLRHVALALRKGGPPLSLVPFYVKLPDWAEAIKIGSNLTLAGLIDGDLKALKPPEGWWERKLTEGDCLILLDGLDEVADLYPMKTWIEKQAALYSKSRFLITSRPDTYRNNSLTGFSSLRLLPLSPKQMKALILNWYASGSPKAGGPAQTTPSSADLLNRLSADTTLQELAVNPLLLTLITIIHASGKPIPERRMELLHAICEASLERRKDRGMANFKLKPRDMIDILSGIAYRMTCLGLEELPERDAAKIVEEYLQVPVESPVPKEFLRLMHETSGIFIEREARRFAFCHRLFREYLAAVCIQQKDHLGTLLSKVDVLFWRETVLLYCGLDDATALIRECLASSQPSADQILLATECLLGAKTVTHEARQLVRAVTIDALEDSDLQRRKLAAELLLIRRFKTIGPPAMEGTIDLSPITFAEYQLFVDAARTEGMNYAPDHWNGWQFVPGTGKMPIVGARKNDADAFCSWLERGVGAGFNISLATPQEVKPLWQADASLRNARLLTDQSPDPNAILSSAEILKQIEQDAHENRSEEELTRSIARIHQRLIWFAVWFTLSRNRDRNTDSLSLGVEVALAIDDVVGHKATRYLDQSSASALSVDLLRGSTTDYEADFDRLRLHIDKVDIFTAHPEARVWDLDLRINQNQDWVIAKASVQGLDRIHSIQRAAHVLNWLCYIEKRSRGDIPVDQVIWIKKSKMAFKFD